MVKTSIIGLIVAGCLTLAYASKHFWRGEVMPIDKVGKTWGKGAFDLKKFKESGEKDRAKMAYSLVSQQKQYLGKDVTEIRSLFGDPDGFYFRDTFPAYIIQRRIHETDSAWQIVFLLDNNFKVSEIFVHKNCCDK